MHLIISHSGKGHGSHTSLTHWSPVPWSWDVVQAPPPRFPLLPRISTPFSPKHKNVLPHFLRIGITCQKYTDSSIQDRIWRPIIPPRSTLILDDERFCFQAVVHLHRSNPTLPSKCRSFFQDLPDFRTHEVPGGAAWQCFGTWSFRVLYKIEYTENESIQVHLNFQSGSENTIYTFVVFSEINGASYSKRRSETKQQKLMTIFQAPGELFDSLVMPKLHLGYFSSSYLGILPQSKRGTTQSNKR